MESFDVRAKYRNRTDHVVFFVHQSVTLILFIPYGHQNVLAFPCRAVHVSYAAAASVAGTCAPGTNFVPGVCHVATWPSFYNMVDDLLYLLFNICFISREFSEAVGLAKLVL